MDYLSFSQINMYLRCGEQYRRRYIEHEVIPPNISLVRGSSVHKTIERNGEQKVESRRDLPKNDIVDYSVHQFDTRIEEENIEAKKEEKGKERDTVASLSGLYADDVTPYIMPKEVEKKIMIDIGVDIPIMCILDLIDVEENIHDFKTAAKSKQQKEADNSLQFTLYNIGHQQEYGRLPNKCIMDVLVNTKTPKHQKLETIRDEFNLVLAMRKVKTVAEGINRQVFLPAAEGSWACDSRYCGYYLTCPYVNAKAF